LTTRKRTHAAKTVRKSVVSAFVSAFLAALAMVAPKVAGVRPRCVAFASL